MPTQTLLDMTQEILSSMSSDEVNSIADTTESMQVATIIKRKYFDIASRSGLPEHNQLIQLTPSGDVTMPVVMYIPDEVNKIEWIKYFNSNSGSPPETSDVANEPGYQYVTILPNQQFIDMINSYNLGESNVSSFGFTSDINGFPGSYNFSFKNDKQPSYCTILSNHYVIFDSFDNTVDSTLQTSKTMCFGQVAPSFTMTDSFVPRLDDKEFPLLLNEAKALAFYELKQMPHQKAEQEIKRQWTSVQKNKSEINRPTHFDQIPNFGRTGSGTYGYPRIRLH